MRVLYYNGKIVSLDKGNNYYEALGTEHNRIVFLGNNKDAAKHHFDRKINLYGKLLLPGFNDSHLHLLSYGYTKKEIDLSNCTSIDQAISLARDYIHQYKVPKGEWVLGGGWNQAKMLENRYFTRIDLDRISIEHPIVFTRTCGHLLSCNSLTIKHIKKPISMIEGSDLSNGIFKENAMDLVYDAINTPSIERIKQYITVTCEELVENGITSVQSDDLSALPGKDFKLVMQAYEELDQNKQLKVRIYQQCSLSKLQLDEFLKLGYKTGHGTTFFKIGPLKLFQDGGLGARTAFLNDEYTDDPGNLGMSLYSQEELDNYISFAHEQGMQVAVHAIGDKAIDMVITAIHKANVKCPRDNARHGIVHCHITNDTILNKLKENQIIIYIQPIFFNNDLRMLEQRVGQRAQKSYVIQSLFRAGLEVSGGSDAPVEHFNPFHNIYCAMFRKDLHGNPGNGFLPNEKISIQEALRLFTINSAYCSFEELDKGTLEIGKLADMIVVDRDLFTASEDDIRDTKVLMTIVDGEIAWRQAGFPEH